MNKNNILYLFIIISIFIACTQHQVQKMEKILVITGGHYFEPSFYKIFNSYHDVDYDTIVYILLGHGHQAHEDPNYRKLIRNAITWVGEKNENSPKVNGDM